MDRTVHLINPMTLASGGSEWRTLQLAAALEPWCTVNVWCPSPPDPQLARLVRMRDLAPGQAFPRGGVLVFVGAYFDFPLDWLQHARPRRVIVVYNTDSPGRLYWLIKVLNSFGLPPVELVFPSRMIQQDINLPGIVQASLVDISRFVPAPRSGAAEFRVGRLSRDCPEKHHPEDAHVYRAVVAQGGTVHIMGGTCLQTEEPAAGVELLPACAAPAERFLQGLDCFYYRTAPEWRESLGRVVIEAMACALPVVCHSSGGYREVINHGRNGFLFDTSAEAIALLRDLHQDAALRARVGAAARQDMEALYSPAARQEVTTFYLR